ncbi:hypothetical protein [Prescottella agglutinans]|uniref:Uncharacterized protein n=1 Tax=Prescottella agglutinans TaxID=1644129 RepID=A0ABT6M6G9_9NOCA|nr:hypothetical protein [Prescottella agglutinans]MDH6279515.1 hypothetical protein [Prescottella agglutinans]
MAEQIPDGEPMHYGRDFAIAIEKGNRVGYQDSNGDIIVSAVTSIDPGPRGSQTITLDDPRPRDKTGMPKEVSPLDRLLETVRRVQATVRELALTQDEPAPDASTPQQRALPRPSHTPPVWAEQPNKQRRTKYGPTRRVK